MKAALLIALLLTPVVHGQERIINDVDAGVVLVPSATFVLNEKACSAAEAERDALKASVKAAPASVPVWLTVVIGVAAAAAGAGGVLLGLKLSAPQPQ